MKPVHRSRTEIIGAILECANGNVIRITEIQFRNILIV